MTLFGSSKEYYTTYVYIILFQLFINLIFIELEPNIVSIIFRNIK